mgnify:CR=1 FL=1
MQPNPMIMNLVRFLHNLFTAVWMGGLFSMALVILPGLRGSLPMESAKLAMAALGKRLKPLALASMAGLAVTGLLLGRSSKNFTGLLSFASPYSTALSVKHILMGIMVVLAFIRLGMVKKLETQNDPKRMRASGMVVMVNAIIGAAVLFLSSMI